MRNLSFTINKDSYFVFPTSNNTFVRMSTSYCPSKGF